MLNEFYLELKVSEAELNQANAALSSNVGDPQFAEGSVMQTHSVNFGEGYEVDIKVVNGDATAGAYVDAILFFQGSEVLVLEPSFEALEGEYIFLDGDNKFTVLVKA